MQERKALSLKDRKRGDTAPRGRANLEMTFGDPT